MGASHDDRNIALLELVSELIGPRDLYGGSRNPYHVIGAGEIDVRPVLINDIDLVGKRGERGELQEGLRRDATVEGGAIDPSSSVSPRGIDQPDVHALPITSKVVQENGITIRKRSSLEFEGLLVGSSLQIVPVNAGKALFSFTTPVSDVSSQQYDTDDCRRMQLIDEWAWITSCNSA